MECNAKVILSLQIPQQVFNYTIKASTSRFHKTQDVYKKENSKVTVPPNPQIGSEEKTRQLQAEAESEEKHGVWDPMPELTTYNLTLCPLQSRLQHMHHGQ